MQQRLKGRPEHQHINMQEHTGNKLKEPVFVQGLLKASKVLFWKGRGYVF